MESNIILSSEVANTSRKYISNNKTANSILTVIRYLFILVYTYASLRVLSDYPMFIREVYGLIVWEPVKWGLAAICIGEIITVFCLVVPKLRYAGFIMAFSMSFAVAISSMIVLQKAPVIPSLFGGIFPSVDFWGHLYINLTLLVVALIGLLLYLNESKVKY